MSSEILNALNEAQKAAVTSASKYLMVLAGAGSGKTRVLVHRIAWLMQSAQVSPLSILAVTFTNKAAAEMRSRIEQLIQRPVGAFWIGTFHHVAHRLLRLHWQEAGLKENFHILDSMDQVRFIRRIMKESGFDKMQPEIDPQTAQSYINRNKEAGLRANSVRTPLYSEERLLRQIYQNYEMACQSAGAVDFAELLLRAYELWRDRPALLQQYQSRFQHILIDEFQDTNTLQYAWIRQLGGESNGITVVGDDDQSIYSWRGADANNLQRFKLDFPQTQLVRLEENYRSTQAILKAANELIAHNPNRLGKNLWTQKADEESIEVYNAYNDRDEAQFVIRRISEWTQSGRPFNECAILYRSNAQSRLFESELLQHSIPYRVYGGLRFFERAEIKDALAYLRLVINPQDDIAFERILNVPARNLGEHTLDTLKQIAHDQSVSLWQAAQAVLQSKQLGPRALQSLLQFINLIQELIIQIKSFTLYQQVEHIINNSQLKEHYESNKKDSKEQIQNRIENLGELINAAKEFESQSTLNSNHFLGENVARPQLSEFLAHTVLESVDLSNTEKENRNQVQLMTLHAAKGLEFPLVFITGLEEGLFPHQMSITEENGLEEERRLCYVGITRAMKKLYLTHASIRRIHGREIYPTPSQFLREIPSSCLKKHRETNAYFTNSNRDNDDSTFRYAAPLSNKNHHHRNNTSYSRLRELPDPSNGIRIGQKVSHPTFGEGIVINTEGSGDKMHVQINFERCGPKWLLASKAKLIIL